MELSVFGIVLIAALFHAAWNTFVKKNEDRVLFMALLMASSATGALVTLPFFDFPAPESWPYLALSVLIHIGYLVFFLSAYKYGDLSHVYPLSRGSAPLIVALLSILLIGEQLSQIAWIAIVIMAIGIMSLSITRNTQKLRNPTAVFFAIGTGLFIAGYTVTDGVGARLAGSAHSYAAWMMALDGYPILAYLFVKRGSKIFSQSRPLLKTAFLGGMLSLAAYWAVIWAMTVAPIALVAAVRETSIIFALLFGVLLLKERLSLMQYFAIFTTMLGTVLLKLNRS
ncbi:DMT family transporter [Sneathiella litorea]|uniref:EamA family transporter n=1 Tax=Sneathiella litorea TaxID=2606216 RepID=A0A6L8WD85_9PROT|nr:DMT family transporter [Sneathiella litorea]MZR32107.1 EamA family transporter [Sneathiella litorea]